MKALKRGRKWTDEEIGSALNIHRNSVGRIRQRFLEPGIKPSLNRRAPQSGSLRGQAKPGAARSHLPSKSTETEGRTIC